MKIIFRYCFNVFFICFFFTACSEKPKYNFTSSLLKNASIQTPTSLQFGLDGRLFVSKQNCIIKIFTIKKNGSNDYTVLKTEILDLINKIPNHNDSGLLDTAIKGRQVTGILVKGSATHPVIY